MCLVIFKDLKMKKIVFILLILFTTSEVMAQENADVVKSYMAKYQKFIESLTPQERIIYMLSHSCNSSSSSSSSECDLDYSTKRKIDDTYDLVKKIHDNLRGWGYDDYKIKCK